MRVKFISIELEPVTDEDKKLSPEGTSITFTIDRGWEVAGRLWPTDVLLLNTLNEHIYRRGPR